MIFFSANSGFCFFFRHSPLWLSFQNWLFAKHLETNGQTALAYLFTIAHTFWNALQSDRLESFWISETTAPFGGLGWQCVSRICSTSFGLSLGQSLSRSPSSFCFLTLFVSLALSLSLSFLVSLHLLTIEQVDHQLIGAHHNSSVRDLSDQVSSEASVQCSVTLLPDHHI